MPQAIAAAAAWIGTTIAAAATAVGVTAGTAATIGTIATAVSQIALTIGMGYAIDSITRPNIKPAGSELTMNIDPAYPREMVIGERQIGGSVVARYSRDVNNYFAHLVIQVADHPCVELSKVYDGGRLVQGTALTHGVRTEITAYSNSGGPRLWMTWHDGRPGQTADADLVTKSATDPEVVSGKIDAWTSNHKGAGCAYVHVEMRWDPDILTQIPQFTFHVKGAKLYDRRLDTTAGGSGSHRLDDPSTWAYSTNAMVALDHFLLGYQVEDDPLAFGIGLSPTEVPYAQFAAAADLCDEDVVTGTGGAVETIKRYAANGVISCGDYFLDVIEALQVQMAARVVDLGGRIGVLGAEERAITVSLTEDDLVGGEPLQFSDKLAFADLIGSVTGTFSDPANNYQPTPYDPLDTAYKSLPDGGEAQAISLPLPFEVHPRRAVRLVSAWAARETLQPRLAAVFMPKAWKLEPGDWFEFTSARLQITAEKFEVIDIVKNDDFTVIVTARAIDPDFLAFDNADDPALSVPPEIAPVSKFLDTPTFTVTATTISAGALVEPALEVTLTSTEVVASEIVYEYAVWSGGVLVDPTYVDTALATQTYTKLRKSIMPTTAYKVRAKSRAGPRQSAWTAWSSAVTTPASAGTANDSVPVGSNGLRDTAFNFQSLYWAGVAQSGTPTLTAAVSTAGLRKSVITGAGVTIGHYLSLRSTLQQTGFICKPGDVIGARVLAGGTNVSQLELIIAFRDAAGIGIGFSTTAFINTGILPGSGEETDFNELTSVATAPSGTVMATIDVRGIASTAAPVLRVAKPVLAVLPAGQTVTPVFAPGREHEAGANVTETRVAASITSQGALATASAAAWATQVSGRPTNVAALAGTESINNALVPVGANGLVDTGFRWQSTYWTKTQVSGSTAWTVTQTTEGLRVGILTGSGVTVNGTDYINGGSMLQRTSFPCKAGDTVGVRVLVGSANASSLQLRIMFRDAAGTLINSVLVSLSSGLLAGTGDETTFNEMSITGVAGAGALTANFEVRAIASTSAPVLRLAKPILAMLQTGQTGIPAYAAANEHEIGANVTETRVAASITSQGTQATANAQRGSSYSGTPVEGSWWTDTSTTPNKLKFYTAGAWQQVATLVSDAAAGVLSASFSPASVNTTHSTSSPLAQAVTVTPAGGSGTYTYVWAVGDVFSGATPTLTGQYTATCTVNVTHNAIGTIDGSISCTITDTVTGKSIVRYWGYYSEGTGGGSGAGGGGGLPP